MVHLGHFTCVGALSTCLALYMATRQFKRGDRKSMNNWLRMRVAAQGFTVVAILTYAFKVRQDRGLTARVEGRHPEAVMTVQTREDKEKREFEERLANAIRTEKENEESRRAERQHEVCRPTFLNRRMIYPDCVRPQHGIGRMCSKRVCSRRTRSGKHRQSKRSRRKQEPRNTIYFVA
jgi:type VI protein secretion system component VasK